MIFEDGPEELRVKIDSGYMAIKVEAMPLTT